MIWKLPIDGRVYLLIILDIFLLPHSIIVDFQLLSIIIYNRNCIQNNGFAHHKYLTINMYNVRILVANILEQSINVPSHLFHTYFMYVYVPYKRTQQPSLFSIIFRHLNSANASAIIIFISIFFFALNLKSYC